MRGGDLCIDRRRDNEKCPRPRCRQAEGSLRCLVLPQGANSESGRYRVSALLGRKDRHEYGLRLDLGRHLNDAFDSPLSDAPLLVVSDSKKGVAAQDENRATQSPGDSHRVIALQGEPVAPGQSEGELASGGFGIEIKGMF